jgi:hypothetical protein
MVHQNVAHKGREVRILVGTGELLWMPTPQGRFEKRRKKLMMRMSLQDDSTNDLGIGRTQLKFKEEVVFEKVEARFYAQKGLGEVDEDGNLKDWVGVKFYQLNVVVFQQLTKKCVAGEPESPLEIGFEDHYFLSVGSQEVFTLGRMLEHRRLVLEEVVVNELLNGIVINGRCLEHLPMGDTIVVDERTKQMKKTWIGHVGNQKAALTRRAPLGAPSNDSTCWLVKHSKFRGFAMEDKDYNHWKPGLE